MWDLEAPPLPSLSPWKGAEWACDVDLSHCLGYRWNLKGKRLRGVTETIAFKLQSAKGSPKEMAGLRNLHINIVLEFLLLKLWSGPHPLRRWTHSSDLVRVLSSSVSRTWGLVRNANSQAPSETYHLKICIGTRSPSDHGEVQEALSRMFQILVSRSHFPRQCPGEKTY